MGPSQQRATIYVGDTQSGLNAFLKILRKKLGRGCTVQWAPKKDVLSHPGSGGDSLRMEFNIGEYLWRGGFRRYAGRVLQTNWWIRGTWHVWRVRLELEKTSGRLSIKNAIRMIGGSSYNSLCNLVEFVSTLPGKIWQGPYLADIKFYSFLLVISACTCKNILNYWW